MMQDELIEEMLAKYEQGQIDYFFSLVDYLIDILVEELQLYPLTDDFLNMGFLSLLCAIRSYHSNQGKGIAFICKYIHLSLLVYNENMFPLSLTRIHFPNDIELTSYDIEYYFSMIRERLKVNKKLFKIS